MSEDLVCGGGGRDPAACCLDGGLNLCVKVVGEEERQELRAETF